MKTLFLFICVPVLIMGQVNEEQCTMGNHTPNPNSGTNGILSSSPNAIPVKFPKEGQMNALFVFIQMKDDTFEHCSRFIGYNADTHPQDVAEPVASCQNRGYTRDDFRNKPIQSFTDDPISEWPVNLPIISNSNGRLRELPNWAKSGFIDEPDTTLNTPNDFPISPNSITEFYDRSSNGKFQLRGKVYPYTYVSEYATDHYKQLASPQGLGAGALEALSAEILGYVNQNRHGINLDASYWDKYTNGYGTNFTPDGKFDMIVFVFRNNSLGPSNVGAQNYTCLAPVNYTCGEIVSEQSVPFGSFLAYTKYPYYNTPNATQFPNSTGSGITVYGYTKSKIIRTTAHEIGHWVYGLVHRNDRTSIMAGNHDLSFSAIDRLQVGWANEKVIQLDTLQIPTYTVEIPFAFGANHNAIDVLRIRSSIDDASSDWLLESRRKDLYTENPLQQNGDDGDMQDSSLPDEGIYFYKSSMHMPNTGKFPAFTNSGTNKLLGNGLIKRRHGGFRINEEITPFTRISYNFDYSEALDTKLAITDISSTANGLSVKIWKDFPMQDVSKNLNSNYSFGHFLQFNPNAAIDLTKNNNLARKKHWQLNGTFNLYGDESVGSLHGSSSSFPYTTILEMGGNAKFNIYGNIGLRYTLFLGNSNSNGVNTWKGITIQNNSNAYLQDNYIQDAAVGAGGAIITINNATPSFENNKIYNNKCSYCFGILINGYTPNQPSFRNNLIESPKGDAFYLTNSARAMLWGNTINLTGNNTGSSGFNLSTFSFPVFGSSGWGGKNRFIGGKYAINANLGIIDAGNYSWTGENCFENQTEKHVNGGSAMGYGYVYAGNNYWSNSNSFYSGNVSNYSPLSSCAGGTTLSKSASKLDMSEALMQAKNHFNDKAFAEAKTIWQGLVTSSTDEAERNVALMELVHLYQETQDKSLPSFIASQRHRNEFSDLARQSLMAMYKFDGDEEAMTALMSEVQSKTGRQDFVISLMQHEWLRDMKRFEEAQTLLEALQPETEAQEQQIQTAAWLFAEISGKQMADFRLQVRAIEIPKEMVLDQNYPNPFGVQTQIRFGLPESGSVRLEVFDVLGRKVQTVVDGNLEAGYHVLPLNGNTLPSGQYFYRLSANGKVLSKSMTIVK